MKFLTATTALSLALLPASTFAAPTGGAVTDGAATITTPDATSTHINQTSQNATLNWSTFDVGADEIVRFIAPNADSVTLNKINDVDASEILGQIDANGKIFLINPNGIVFGAGSRVDVGGLVATTSELGTSQLQNFDPIDNTYHFQGTGNAATITNNGTITAADGGLIALVAPTVQNNGTLTARLGKVTLQGGENFTLDLYGDKLISLAADSNLTQAIVENTGHISADGGAIRLSATQASNALNNVVNMSGVAEANTIDTTDGRIVLSADGGTTTFTGNAVAAGGAVRIGGGWQGNEADFADVPNSAITNASGNINVSGQGAANAGSAVVWADTKTTFTGNIQARGGDVSGDGGDVEVSGKETLVFAGSVDTTAPNGTTGNLLLDPINITITDGAGGADDAEIADGLVSQTETPTGSFVISENALEALAETTNVNLQATNDLTINDLTDNALTLAATGDVVFTADADNDGNGAFTMASDDTITTQGANVTISGDTLTLGGINTSAGSGGDITLFTTGSGNITLKNNLNTAQGNITLNADTLLANDIGFNTSTGGGDLTFIGDVTGAQNMSVSLGGSGNFSAGNIDIGGINFVDGNTINLGGNITTDTALDFTGLANITLTADTNITATDGSTRQNLTFSSANIIDGAHALTLTGDSINVNRIGGSTPLTSLTITADNALDLTDTVTTLGTQTYAAPTVDIADDLTTTNSTVSFNNAITLSGNSTISTGSGGGNITVGDTINGSQALTLNAGTGSVNIGSAVGGSTAVGSLIASGNAITLNGVTSVNDQTYTGATTIQGTFSNAGGDVTFNDAVTLAANTIINTTGGNGNVTFTDTIDGAFNLTATTGGGQVALQGIVGGNTALNLVDLQGNSVALNTITTTNGQNFAGALTLLGDLTVNSGGITLTGNVGLGANSTLTSGGLSGDDITITGAMTGDHTLNLVAGLGNLILNGIDVDTLTLTSGVNLNASGNIITDSALDFTNIAGINLTTDATLAAFDGTTAADIILDSANSITGSGNLTLQGRNIGLYSISGIDDLTVTSQDGGATTINTAISTAGAQTYTGAVIANANLTAANAAITVNDALTLGVDTTLTSGGGDITLAGATDGAQTLTLNAGSGAVNVTGNIGSSTPITSFNATGDTIALANVTTSGALNTNGATTFNGLATGGSAVVVTGNSTLGGGGIATTNGSMTLNGTVTLADNATLTTGGNSGDDLTINGAISGDYNLDIVAGSGDVTLASGADINGLSFTSGNDLTLSGGTYTADTGFNFSALSDILLSADTTLNATDGTTRADIIFGSGNTILGAHNLNLLGDAVTLYTVGDNGANDPLSLTVDAQTANLLGDIFTVGTQTYTSIDGLASNLTTQGADITIDAPLTLLGDVTLATGAGTGDINISGAVDGAHNFVLNAGLGDITTTADFGTTTPLTSIALTGQALNITGQMTTTGNQTYTGPTTLDGSLTTNGGNLFFNDTLALVGGTLLDTGAILNGDITFNDAVNSPQDLTLSAGTGDILFARAAGSTTRLGNITVNSANDVTFNEGLFAASYTQTSGTGDVNFGFTPGLDSTGNITVTGVENITGRMTGGRTALNPRGLTNVTVDVASLLLGGGQTEIFGVIAGRTGRDAARLVRYTQFTGGPHYMNGYTLPLLGDFAAPQTFTTTALADFTTPSGITLDYTAGTRSAMNPFTERFALFANAPTALVDNTLATTPFWQVYLDDEGVQTLN